MGYHFDLGTFPLRRLREVEEVLEPLCLASGDGAAEATFPRLIGAL